ncbi:hypothetical protein Bca101_017459 [Brassica carinata]
MEGEFVRSMFQQVTGGKLYIRSNTEKDYVYDPKEGKWNVSPKVFRVAIDKIWYIYEKKLLVVYHKESKGWKVVRGLDTVDMNPPGRVIEMANYGGKLLWDNKLSNNRPSIYCAMIALERRNGDEVWGNIEWANACLRLGVLLISCVLK